MKKTLKEDYPELASKTILDIVNSDEFSKQCKLAIQKYSKVGHKANYYAYVSLKNDGELEIENFKKNYIECFDKISKLPFSKRVVVYAIGDIAYTNTIKQMMKEYDEKRNKFTN